jgi:hypothetical protein
VRSNYTEEEVLALLGVKELLAGEITRMTGLAATCLNHLVNCETSDHRAEVAKRAGAAISALLQHFRYSAWIEAELTSVRVFEKPVDILAELIEQQNALAEAARAKLEPEPQPELTAENTVVGEDPAEAMDKLANAPSTKTKQ